MDDTARRPIRELLDTFGQGLTGADDTGLIRQDLTALRRQATDALVRARGRFLEETVELSALSDEDWLRTARLILDQIEAPYRPRNVYDREILGLMEHLWSRSAARLSRDMIDALGRLRREDGRGWQAITDHIHTYRAFWGDLDPDRGIYETFQRRASVLKRHSYDFLWLYRRLEDYLSKRALTAILFNWATLDREYLRLIRSPYLPYWETDLFPDNIGDVLVDCGAYTGDSIQEYVEVYGQGYRKIYAYEIEEANCAALRRTVAEMGLHDVEIRRRGVGRARGEMSIGRTAGPSASHLSPDGGGDRVEVVPLDEDLDGPVTFVKMDIEGAETDALLGLTRTIREQRPKLAVCVYHGYDDLWRIPLLIDGIWPGYRFYLRHNGGDLFPTEFVLLCVP